VQAHVRNSKLFDRDSTLQRSSAEG